jgi:hypothetical protein
MQSIILKDSPKTKPTKNPIGIKSDTFSPSSGHQIFNQQILNVVERLCASKSCIGMVRIR